MIKEKGITVQKKERIAMKKIHIVLYSPEIPQNTGNISRTAVVTGASLHIIRPIGFEISDRTLKRAGLDYWNKLDVRYYENYEDFLCKNPDAEAYYFSAHGKNSYANHKFYQDYGNCNGGALFWCIPDKLLCQYL